MAYEKASDRTGVNSRNTNQRTNHRKANGANQTAGEAKKSDRKINEKRAEGGKALTGAVSLKTKNKAGSSSMDTHKQSRTKDSYENKLKKSTQGQRDRNDSGREDSARRGKNPAAIYKSDRNQEIQSGRIKQKGITQEAGSRRRRSICPYDEKCGGCKYLYLSYPDQLKEKETYIRSLLDKHCKIAGMIGMEEPWHYRNKVNAVFSRDRKGNVISGVYEEGSHRVVGVDRCLIEDELADRIIGTIRGMLKSFKIKTYDEDSQYGLLRYVLIRRAFATGEVMVVLVTASPILPSKRNFTQALLKAHPEITTVIQNVNTRTDSLVLGERQQILHGKGYIEDILCGCRFRISPASFYQINPVQTQKLYSKAMELAGLTGRETVIDAYSGIGTIGMIAAAKAGKVISVELNPMAVKDAVANAKGNGIKNIEFYKADAGEFLSKMAQDGENADVLFMDPPRSGSTDEFLQAAAQMGPEKIVYISCNPETLARDLETLAKLNYRCVEGWGIDLFPWTSHIEVVIQMTYCGDKKK